MYWTEGSDTVLHRGDASTRPSFSDRLVLVAFNSVTWPLNPRITRQFASIHNSTMCISSYKRLALTVAFSHRDHYHHQRVVDNGCARRQPWPSSFRGHVRHSTISDRAFCAAAPRVWNDLPHAVTSSPSLNVWRHIYSLTAISQLTSNWLLVF